MTKPHARPARSAGAGNLTSDVDFTSDIRTGEDVRHRGWFWHWNELHTEYGPLLQHSGIGLITSYIVWTDRRDDSPYRGYAFPSLNTQAAFSGSDRGELMTINRILEALDLIEIRKEMVLRIDSNGKNCRVPHNLYRVKDRSEDPHLTARDVLHVLNLADKRPEVYRHIRHVLVPGFQPISSGNIWHRLLAELKTNPLWIRLAEKAAAEEARFADRARKGHQSRRGNAESATGIESSAPAPVPTAIKPGGSAPIGIDIWVPGETAPASGDPGDQKSTGEEINNALSTIGELFNHAGGSSDELSNGAGPGLVELFTRKEDKSQTTTTTTNRGSDFSIPVSVTDENGRVTEPVTTTTGLSQIGNGPGAQTAGDGDGPNRAVAMRAFAEANQRLASPAEERLLGQIAQLVPDPDRWKWVSDAIYEAVDTGSEYVAPKRVREIVRRWLVEGREARVAEVKLTERSRSGRTKGGATRTGRQSRSISAEQLPEQEIVIAETPPAVIDLQPLRSASGESIAPPEPFFVAEAGLASGQLWGAVLDVIRSDGAIRSSDIRDYLESASLVERADSRTFVVRARDALSVARIDRYWSGDIEDAVSRVLGGKGWRVAIISGEESVIAEQTA